MCDRTGQAKVVNTIPAKVCTNTVNAYFYELFDQLVLLLDVFSWFVIAAGS